MLEGFLVLIENTTDDVVLTKPTTAAATKKKKSGEQLFIAVDDDDHTTSSNVFMNRHTRSQSAIRRVTPTTTATITGHAVEKHLPNGDLYTGDFSGSAPHGSGKYLWRDGCMYEGEWRRGKASGKGKFSWPSGATFEGEFKSGRMEGFGTFTGSDGDTYRGSWVADRKQGFGQKRYANGDFYEGNWKKNLQDGHGRYVWRNGNEYVGEWKSGVMSGRGTLIWANGNRYEGDWECGVPKGNGVYIHPDGSCCVGSWNCNANGVGKDVKGNVSFVPVNGKEEGLEGDEIDSMLMTSTMRKRSSVDGGGSGGRGSGVAMTFPRICIWESDGEAGDITCDILDNVEASLIYRDGLGLGFDPDGARPFTKGGPCGFDCAQVKKPGQTISKGHKNYDLMLNLQIGIR